MASSKASSSSPSSKGGGGSGLVSTGGLSGYTPVVYETSNISQSYDLNTTAYKSSVPLYRIRPMLKTEKEIQQEKDLYFEIPRKSCYQICPELKRIFDETTSKTGDFVAHTKKGRTKGKSIAEHQPVNAQAIIRDFPSQIQHRWHILKRILKRARYKHVESDILPYLYDLDRSDKIIPEGSISQRAYNEIFHTRDFDLYGNMMYRIIQPPRKHLEMRYIATKLGIEYTQAVQDEVVEVEEDENDEGDDIVEEDGTVTNSKRRKPKIEKLTTAPWDIGREPIYNVPVGLAKNPSEPYNSLGNEHYYSYDGTWKHGKMHGRGKYLFDDNCAYEGEFENNRPHGYGYSHYPHGQEYEGEWKEGKYSGKGLYTTKDGVKYDGEFYDGKRHGIGRLEFPSGLVYEGEFFNNKPHGRGVMKSKLTGWAYDGNFKDGFIRGMGQIITPPPKCEHIIYYWDDKKPDVTLPSLVKHYLTEREEEKLKDEQRRNMFQAPLRGAQLKEYVTNIRATLHGERAKEKRDRYNATVQKAKEEKAKLYEARIKALAGDD